MKTYIFIDGQNLHLSTKLDNIKNNVLISKGWEIDYKKLFIFLNDKYRTKEIYIFLGYVPKYNGLYKYLSASGYKIIFKPSSIGENNLIKGNVDVDLTLHCAAIKFLDYNRAVVISGDGDFYSLYNFLLDKNKLHKIIIPNIKKQSKLLNKFNKYKVYLESHVHKIKK